MPAPSDPNPDPAPAPAGERRDPEQAQGDAPAGGPTSDPPGRDFGDSTGYGGGGSTRDYQEVVGENPVTAGRPNPLDAVIPPGRPGGRDEDGHDPDSSS